MKKTLILLAALALSATSPSFAQNPAASAKAQHGKGHHEDGRHGKGHNKGNKTPEQKSTMQATRLTKELSLNASQQAQVKQILLARQQEQQSLKAKYADNKKEVHAEMKALRARYDDKLKATFTADQYARYDKMREEKHSKMKEHRNSDKMKVKSKG